MPVGSLPCVSPALRPDRRHRQPRGDTVPDVHPACCREAPIGIFRVSAIVVKTHASVPRLPRVIAARKLDPAVRSWLCDPASLTRRLDDEPLLVGEYFLPDLFESNRGIHGTSAGPPAESNLSILCPEYRPGMQAERCYSGFSRNSSAA